MEPNFHDAAATPSSLLASNPVLLSNLSQSSSAPASSSSTGGRPQSGKHASQIYFFSFGTQWLPNLQIGIF